MTLTLRYAAISDRGLIRSGNQDSVYAGPRLIAVADGMGGMAAGDLASSIVIGSLAVLDEDVPRGDLTAALADAVEEANSRIRATVEENPEMEGMGTTLTAFLFSGSSLGMIHIGDSRAYRLRDGVLRQVTKDDTYVQMLVDEGQLSPDEAETHPQRSLLLRALGSHEVEPTFATLDPRPGDRLLLCSDGLSGVVSDDTIAETLGTVADPHAAADRLVQLALRGGGPDNVTVLVADLTDSGVAESEPIVAGAAAAGDDPGSAADPTTAAARAAATTGTADTLVAPPAEEEVPSQQSHRRRGRAGWYVLAGALVLAIVASVGFLMYSNRFYVGVDDHGDVAVFKGFEGEVLGVELSSLESSSNVPVEYLTSDARQRVTDGIPADSRDDAYRIMSELTGNEANLLEVCPENGDPTETGDDESEPEDSASTEAGQSGPDCRPTD